MPIITKRTWSKSVHGGHITYADHGSAQVREHRGKWRYEVFLRGKLVASGEHETRGFARAKAEWFLDRD
jgi:hypothetical protein